jgi:hypothetical protein
MGRDGAGAKQIGRDHGYRWPVFDPQDRRLAVLRGGQIEIVSMATGIGAPLAGGPVGVELLVTWAAAGIGYIGEGKRLSVADPETGKVNVGEPIDPATTEDLLRATRSCNDAYVTDEELNDPEGLPVPRIDVIVRTQQRTRGGDLLWPGVRVTKNQQRRTNMDPFFSHDCKRIVFVAG